MDADFLGQGWRFPIAFEDPSPRQDAAGAPVGRWAVARSRAEAGIEQSIWLILGTAKGERLMRPDFGCGLQDFVFALDGATTAGRVADEVRDALASWEPRIDVLAVDVGTADGDATLLIDVTYEVRATNTVFNLVYPFYRQGGAP